MESLLQRCWANLMSQFHKHASLSRSVGAFVLIMSILTRASAQLAPVSPPGGGFRIDGGLKANTPTANQGDWVFGPGGTGDSVLRYNGTPFNSAFTGLRRDLYNSGSDSVFAQGSKFNDYISSLHWTASTAPNKNDINNAMYHVSTNPVNGDQWIMIAGDRLSTDGTSYIDFEFLQDSVKVNSNGSFTGNGPAGGRTVGDLIASIEYNNGGSTANVIFYKWILKSGTYQYDSTGSAAISLAGNAFAITNAANEDVPFSAFGSTTYAPFSFVEAAVNVTQLLNALGGGNCSGLKIKTLWIKTKASSVTNAALKDFVTPISVSFSFGGVSIDAKGPVCVDGSPITLTGSPAGGQFSSPDPGVSGTTFDPSVAGVGSHKIYYQAAAGPNCTKKDSMFIQVNAKPTATVNSPTKCANDAAVTITATPGSGSASDYNYAWTVPATATAPGNVQSFSATVAGSYSVVLTNKTTGCTSVSAGGTLTVNSNPSVTVNSPTKCANDPGVTITATPGSGAASDYNYAWTVPATATAPGNVQSFSATVAGTYSVIITNKNTGCSSASSGGTLTVNANPTVTVNSPTKCSNDANVTVTATPGTGAGSDYNYAWTVPASFTNPGNVQSFQTGTAGQYSVIITDKTTGCSSASGAGTVTVNANPAAPSVSITEPSLCGSPTATLTVTNPIVGGIYNISQDAGGATFSSVTYASGPLSFSGLVAGKKFYLTVTTNSCVSATRNCTNINDVLTSRAVTQTENVGQSQTTVKAYPNPFSDKINFVVTTPVSGNGSLDVYNMMGQKVRTIYQGFISAGTQTFQMNSQRQQVENLIYVLRIGDKKISGRILQINK